jgi:hypothetical protein
MGRTVTIRDGRVGAEGRLGEEYAVVGRDGAVHLPPDVLAAVPAGTLLRVRHQPDGTIRLEPARPERAAAGPGAGPRPGPE